MGTEYQATHLRRKETYPLYEEHLEIGNCVGAITLGIAGAATSAWITNKLGAPAPLSVLVGYAGGMFCAMVGVSISSSIVQRYYSLKEKFSTQENKSRDLASIVNTALPQSPHKNPSSQ